MKKSLLCLFIALMQLSIFTFAQNSPFTIYSNTGQSVTNLTSPVLGYGAQLNLQRYSSASNYTFETGAGNNDDLRLFVNSNWSSPILAFKTNGYVGIGTPTPNHKLHVEGNLFINTGSLLINQTASSNAKLYFSKLDNYTWDLGTEVSDPSNNFILFNRTNSTYPISFSTTNVVTFKTDKIRLEGMANGGVNTWDIRCRDIVDNDFGVYNVSQSAYRMYINGIGNLGIGTTNPQYRIDIAGNANVDGGLDINGPLIQSGGGITQTGDSPNLNNASFVNTSSSGYGLYSSGGGNGKYVFHFLSQAGATVIYGRGDGNIGIGTTDPGNFKLAVNGKIWAQEVQVATNMPVPDYVFEPNYKLLSLEEIKSYIDQHKHLPEVPSAKEMETNGVNVSEMNMLLLKKIEELTLHVIELKNENDRQNKIIQELTSTKK